MMPRRCGSFQNFDLTAGFGGEGCVPHMDGSARNDNRIAMRFGHEWHEDSGNWSCGYGKENWEFEAHGLMRRPSPASMLCRSSPRCVYSIGHPAAAHMATMAKRYWTLRRAAMSALH